VVVLRLLYLHVVAFKEKLYEMIQLKESVRVDSEMRPSDHLPINQTRDQIDTTTSLSQRYNILLEQWQTVATMLSSMLTPR